MFFKSCKFLAIISGIVCLSSVLSHGMESNYIDDIKSSIDVRIRAAEEANMLEPDDERKTSFDVHLCDEFKEMPHFLGLTADKINTLLNDQNFLAWLKERVGENEPLANMILELVEYQLKKQLARTAETLSQRVVNANSSDQKSQERFNYDAKSHSGVSTSSASSGSCETQSSDRSQSSPEYIAPSELSLDSSSGTQQSMNNAVVQSQSFSMLTVASSQASANPHTPVDQIMISERKEQQSTSVAAHEESFPLFRLESRPGSAFSRVASRIVPSANTGAPRAGTVSYTNMLHALDNPHTPVDQIMFNNYAALSMARPSIPFRIGAHSAFARSGASSVAAASTSSASAASYSVSDSSTAPVLMDTSDHGSEHKQADPVAHTTSEIGQQIQTVPAQAQLAALASAQSASALEQIGSSGASPVTARSVQTQTEYGLSSQPMMVSGRKRQRRERQQSVSVAAASTSSASAASYSVSDSSTASVFMGTSDRGSEHKQADPVARTISGTGRQGQTVPARAQPASAVSARQFQAPARIILRAVRRQHLSQSGNAYGATPEAKEQAGTLRSERDALKSSSTFARAYYFVKQIMLRFDGVATLRYGQEYPEHDRLENRLLNLFIPHVQLADSKAQLIEIVIKVASELEEDSMQFCSDIRQELQQLFMGLFVQDLINLGFLPGIRIVYDIKESSPSRMQGQKRSSRISYACGPCLTKYYYR